MADDYIKGYRVYGDRPRERQLATDYIHQTPRAAKLLKVLWETPGKSCEGRTEEFSGDDLPTDREAQLACSSCPALSLCREYTEEAHPAWGLWAGTVRGRRLAEAMADD